MSLDLDTPAPCSTGPSSFHELWQFTPTPIAHVPTPPAIIKVKSSPPPVIPQCCTSVKWPHHQATAQPTHIPNSPPPTFSCSPLPIPPPLPPPKIPNKHKGKASAKGKDKTEVYGLFIKMPKKQSRKKTKPLYDQYGPWEFKISLSWAKFCDSVAQNLSCTSTALEIDSFSWWQKATGPGTNVRNKFGYGQMISRIRILWSDPIPNVYLIMN